MEELINTYDLSTHTHPGDLDSLAETIGQCSIGNPAHIEKEVSQHISNREHVKAMFLSGKEDGYFRSVINTYYPKKYDFQYGHANDQFTIECQHFPGHCLLTLKDSNGRFLAKKRITDNPPIDHDTGAKPKEIIQGKRKIASQEMESSCKDATSVAKTEESTEAVKRVKIDKADGDV